MSQPISVLNEILSWSTGRPKWQRDALRRIVQNVTLTDQDTIELERLCRLTNNVPLGPDEPPVTAEPLAKTHLPASTASADTISLDSMGHLKNVGRLPNDQSLTFGASPGLTIIFGDNGTGKSGYARVLKRACRARGGHVEPIEGDVFANQPHGKAEALIAFKGPQGVSQQAWKDDGAVSIPQLGSVFVFDRHSAKAHVEGANPAEFTPFGLDILPKLSEACENVARCLRERARAILNETPAAITSPEFGADTEQGAFVAQLSATTKADRLDNLAEYTDEHAAQLQSITTALSVNPLAEAAAVEAAANRVRTLHDRLSTVTTALSDESLAKLHRAMTECRDATEAARIAADNRFDDTYLAGTGGSVWKRLWQAARDYSTNAAYPQEAFPKVDTGARCVLCQQSIDGGTAERLRRFESFVQDRTQAQARTAKQTFDAEHGDFLSLADHGRYDGSVLADIRKIDATAIAQIRAFAHSVIRRWLHVERCIRSGEWSDPPAIQPPPTQLVSKIIFTLTTNVNTLREAHDPQQRAGLQAKQLELKARSWLSRIKQEVLEHIDRLKRHARIQKCLEETTTNAITIKTNDLTEKVLTKQLCDRFAEECKKLKLTSINVEYVAIRGEKKRGQLFKCRLTNAPNADLSRIASEGEYRCVALAGFLAEISQAPHKSAVILDDPVSSLDHKRRRYVAARLIEEAKERQVIVFTHDAVFLHELLSCTDGVAPAHIQSLYHMGDRPGYPQEGFLWDHQRYKARIDSLEKEAAQLRYNRSNLSTPNYEAVARDYYSKLRATIERVIEDVLFNGVIFRFDSYMRVGKIGKVATLETADCDAIHTLWQRCCDITAAHDPASGRQLAVPEPDELVADVTQLKATIDAIKARW